jgi:hypothetical protein
VAYLVTRPRIPYKNLAWPRRKAGDIGAPLLFLSFCGCFRPCATDRRPLEPTSRRLSSVPRISVPLFPFSFLIYRNSSSTGSVARKHPISMPRRVCGRKRSSQIGCQISCDSLWPIQYRSIYNIADRRTLSGSIHASRQRPPVGFQILYCMDGGLERWPTLARGMPKMEISHDHISGSSEPATEMVDAWLALPIVIKNAW